MKLWKKAFTRASEDNIYVAISFFLFVLLVVHFFTRSQWAIYGIGVLFVIAMIYLVYHYIQTRKEEKNGKNVKKTKRK
ncbi:hypothetical protein G7062_01665 [Erysipelothrix sp. HDW6C]|uniref:hypothetical protein n=1 Tax=Erysipelothrix sp. HDW6C TaxID=2714930 RepID=UPI00140D0A09|nr:hypothetical protein [Erysipelothrix sp. HDW6C]QIK69066.1 hypothetical protein G7062_01665 [Erysipelothrix sp. HDW6C]